MGTNNFSKVNTSKYYVVETEDEYAVNDLKLNLNSEFETAGGDYGWQLIDEPDIGRNATEVGIFYIDIPLVGTNLEMRVNVCVNIVYGYYEGAVLDYNIGFEVVYYGEEYTEAKDAIATIIEDPDYFDLPEDTVITEAEVDEWLKVVTKAEQTMKAKAEEIFTNYSVAYNLVATASNGEAFYERVSDE